MVPAKTAPALPPASARQERRLWRLLAPVLAAWIAFIGVAGVPLTGADLSIYRHIAQRALAGLNPYVDPHADYPPLKMALFALLERTGTWPLFLCTLAALHAGLLYVYLARRYPHAPLLRLCALLPALAPTVVLGMWYSPFEDKAAYVSGVLALLLLVPDLRLGERLPRRAPAAWPLLGLAGLLAGLLQSYGGAGVALLPLLLCWPLRGGRRGLRAGAALCGGFVLVVAVTHLAYVPHWIAGYAVRNARMHSAAPACAALWLIPQQLFGFYNRGLPALSIGAVTLGAYALFARGRLRLHGACALAAGAGLALGPEPSTDRIVAAVLPVLYVSLRRWPLAALSVPLLYLTSTLVAENTSDVRLLLLVWALPALCAGALLRAPQATGARRAGRRPHLISWRPWSVG